MVYSKDERHSNIWKAIIVTHYINKLLFYITTRIYNYLKIKRINLKKKKEPVPRKQIEDTVVFT